MDNGVERKRNKSATFSSQAVIITSSIYRRRCRELLGRSDASEIQSLLKLKPASGDKYRGSDGLYALRWIPEGKVKTVTIVYSWHPNSNEVRLMYVYPSHNQ